MSTVPCCILRSLPTFSNIQINIQWVKKGFNCSWSFQLVLRQAASQSTVLCAVADYKKCRWILTRALCFSLGNTGFTGFSLNSTVSAVWSTACLICRLWLSYFGQCCTAAFFNISFALFRFDLASFRFFWFTLFWFAVRWFPMLLQSLAWLRGCDWWWWLDGGRADPGGQCSQISLYWSVWDNHLTELVIISLLLSKVYKHLQKKPPHFSFTLIHL